jgi:hypothetical protein
LSDGLCQTEETMTAAHAIGRGDHTQRSRLARILRDPDGYYAEARRLARDEAKRTVARSMERIRRRDA